MRILDRAFVREVLQTFLATVIILFAIFLAAKFVNLLSRAASGGIPTDQLLTILTLQIIRLTDAIAMMALYVSMLMVLNRWNRDNEMTVAFASGIGLSHFIKPALVITAVVGVLVLAISTWLAPLASLKSEQIINQFKSTSDLEFIKPGVFHETRSGGGVYFVEGYNEDKQIYENLFAYKSAFDREGVVVARFGYQTADELTGDDFLILQHGTRYEGNPGRPDYRVIDFETYAIRLDPKQEVLKAPPGLRSRSTLTLWKSDHVALKGELQWRLSKALALPALCLFALAFTGFSPRSRRISSMAMAFLAYFVYANAISFAYSSIDSGSLDPRLGIWVVHAVFLSLAMVLVWRRMRRPAAPLFWGR